MENGSSLSTSRKFWMPVGIAVLTSFIAVFFALITAFAGGAHAKSSNTGPVIGSMLFPFAALFFDKEGALGSILLSIAFLLQFPVYGIVAGYGNFHGRLRTYLLGLFIVHLAAYLLSRLA
jgi:hypothetical protein